MSPLTSHARRQLRTVALQLGLLTLVVQAVGVVAVWFRHGPGTVVLHLVAGMVVSAALVAFGLLAHDEPDTMQAPGRRRG